ncbi:hypothetical protein CARUB_v10011745mg [Capsella rubella]|uniref:Uncharacterized protein n=1 Tax=Capsella rubella TaxID=81985 RepID=R0IKM1_9BRAS|nr:hypothetical protein CARUB_v10011745mg [Capsella rubella]
MSLLFNCYRDVVRLEQRSFKRFQFALRPILDSQIPEEKNFIEFTLNHLRWREVFSG